MEHAEALDVLVIGAGVVGLACARALARAGHEVLVLERHRSIGTETSSRNSEVIHAGIYYPTGSLRARLCVAGREQLYRYCAERGVPHRRCGKLIVATDAAQRDTLRQYQRQARANGAGELRWLERAELLALEPQLDALAAVRSDATGIIDSHAFMLALQGDLEAAGGLIAFGTEAARLAIRNGCTRVVTRDLTLAPRWLINCAGLGAPDLARDMLPDTPQARYARGHYYSYSGAAPFSRLIYPVAEAGGLGVHVTLDLAGQVRFGPDVQWIERPDYAFDSGNRERFVAAIRRYFPALEADRLQPGYTGIRPKISGPGEPAADFRIDGPAQHRVAGLINLFGIESPGLTASLAIAARVADLVEGRAA